MSLADIKIFYYKQEEYIQQANEIKAKIEELLIKENIKVTVSLLESQSDKLFNICPFIVFATKKNNSYPRFKVNLENIEEIFYSIIVTLKKDYKKTEAEYEKNDLLLKIQDENINDKGKNEDVEEEIELQIDETKKAHCAEINIMDCLKISCGNLNDEENGDDINIITQEELLEKYFQIKC